MNVAIKQYPLLFMGITSLKTIPRQNIFWTRRGKRLSKKIFGVFKRFRMLEKNHIILKLLETCHCRYYI